MAAKASENRNSPRKTGPNGADKQLSTRRILIGKEPVARISIPKEAEAPVRLAAKELQKYLKKSLGASLETVVEDSPGKGSFFLSVARPGFTAGDGADLSEREGHDRVVISGKDGGVSIIGENPVSVLYGVYDFLKTFLDIRFFAPGEEHEHVPTRAALKLDPRFVMRFSSGFEIRDWVNRTNDPEVFSFAVKNRINSILGCGPWKDGSDRCGAENADLIHSFGLKVRGPGHSWKHFVPGEGLFAEHPEYFPLVDGKRVVNNRTACFSNPEARKIFLANLRAYLRKHPYWDIFAFWAEDTPDMSYCGCEECRKMATTDWYITLVNEAAEILEQEIPSAIFELIVYQGTRVPPGQVGNLWRDGKNMLVNVCLGQSRDLFNPIQKETCGSAEVLKTYRNWREYLGGAGFSGRIMLMEYYNLCEWPNFGPSGRALLWPMEVIREDIRFYEREGLDGLGAFTGFDRLCWPSPFNMWCWLQLWSDPDMDVESLKDDFFQKYFGEIGPSTRDYMDRLKEAMRERTSAGNVARVRELSKILDGMAAPSGNGVMQVRLDMLRSHHQYCALLKEMFLAFLDGDNEKWRGLKETYLSFFEKHRAEMAGRVSPFPPLWTGHWFFLVDFRDGRPLEVAEDVMGALR